MDNKIVRYRQAAVGYFIYGVLYLLGAVHLVGTGASTRAAEGGGIVWFVIGAVILVALPVLLWMQLKWVARVLAVLVLVRIVGLVRVIIGSEGEPVPLPWGGEVPRSLGAGIFLGVAVVVCILLVRAGWSPGAKHTRDAGPEGAPKVGAKSG